MSQQGNSAWTPVENTYNHFLTIDLGYKSTTRKIATMGRPLTNEFVTEYIVQYSDDGEYWRSYVNPSSEPQVIKMLLPQINYKFVGNGKKKYVKNVFVHKKYCP